VKVAFVLGTSTGGTGRHVRMLVAGAVTQGLLVEVFGPAQTDRDFGFSAAGAGFTELDIADRPRLRADLRAITRLHRLLRAWRPDVVHAHGLRAGALAALALALVRPTVHHARPALVVTVHNAPAAGGVTGAIYRVLERIVARRADSVLCVSPDLEERMRAAGARRVGRAPVPAFAVPPLTAAPPAVTAPPAVPASAADDQADPVVDVSAETFASDLDADPGRPVVLAVGRLAAQKGFGTLLEAAARWGDIQPQPLLVIVGEGPLEAELRNQAARLRVDARFAGQRDDVAALLAASAVFVLPSRWEGQPLILQEALAAAVPVVATRVGGTPQLTGEDAALLVPPGDSAALADAVRAVLTDPGLAARLRKAAVDRAQALPTAEDAVAAALAEYDLVNRAGR
jgi:glycosyltransferase involved in cell wall biosynthesis